MTEIEEDIKTIIRETTGNEYISKLQVSHDGDIWTLYLFLNRELVPLVMSIQGDEEHFKLFVRDELRKRRLQEVEYWKTDRTLPALECNEDGELEIGW